MCHADSVDAPSVHSCNSSLSKSPEESAEHYRCHSGNFKVATVDRQTIVEVY